MVTVYWLHGVSGGTLFFFFFKQKTAYEIRPRDWSSDVCSSDLDDVGDRRFFLYLAADRVDDRHLRLLAHVRLLVVVAGPFAEHAGVAVVEADEAHARRLQLP